MVNKVELKVKSISDRLAQSQAYALLLKEVGGERQLPVIIGATEAQAIVLVMKKYVTQRPFTHDLFVSFAHSMNATLKEVVIYRAYDGIFYSYLYFEKDGEVYQIDSRTSDAITIAMKMDAPIYTTEEILEKESIRFDEGGPISIPITAVDPELLKEALEKAVSDEDYELASKIRDEIHRRKEAGMNPDDNLLNL